MKEQDQENNLENRLRDKAAGFRLKPSEKVWTNVKSTLEKEKRKRRFIWLWAASVGILLGAGTAGWYFLNHSSSMQEANENIAVYHPAAADNETKNADRSKAAFNRASTFGDLEQKQTDAANGEGENNQPSTKQNTTIAEKNNFKKQSANKTIHTVNMPSDTEGTIVTVNKLHEQVKFQKDELDFIAYPSNQIAAVNNITEAKSKTSADPFPVELYTDYNRSRFSLSAEFIPLISFSTLKYQAKTENATTDVAYISTYVKESNNLRHPKFGYSAGIFAEYAIAPKFSVAAAIHFTQTGTTNQTLSLVYGAVYDSSSGVAGPGTLGFYSNQDGKLPEERYRWIDLSLNGKWYFFQHQKNRLAAQLGTGISHFNQYQYHSPYFPAGELSNSALFTNNQETAIYHVYQFTANTGIVYDREISRNLTLFAGAQFHYYLTNIYLEQASLVEHPYWYGINAGVTCRF